MKRSRYTVHFENGERKVVLCYDAEFAASYYRERGYSVVKVERGDYRRKQRDAAVQGQGGWTLNKANLTEAIEFLGIQLPVNIRTHSRVGGTAGNHTLKRKGGRVVHDIMVKSYLKPELAGEVLWHELTHAMQSERVCEGAFCDIFTRWATTSERNGRYSRRPIEVEARAHEQFNAELPLAR